MICQRLYKKLVAELRIEDRNPGAVVTTQPLPSPKEGTRHTTGLGCSKRTQCPCKASLRNLPSAKMQEPCAGNY